MNKRDEYVESLKGQIDRWNAQLARWEKDAATMRADLRKTCDAQLAELRAQREKTLYQLKLVEGASAAAWADIARGADEAAKHFGTAVAQASKHFTKAR